MKARSELRARHHGGPPWALVALIFLLPGTARAAAGLSAQAVLSESRITTGEVVTLEITAVTGGEGDVEIDVPAVEGLDELRRGNSESTSIAWTGAGQTVRREQTLRIDYEAKKPGRLSIPAISVRQGTDRASTAPLSLEVVGNPSDNAQAATPVPGEVTPPEPGEEDIFIRYRADKAKAFVGEQVLVSLEIFTSGSFNLDENRPPPSPDGFWREIVEQANQLNPRPVRIAGKNYRAYQMWRLALFGIDAGVKTVPSVQLTFSQSRGIFDSGRRLRRSAPPLAIEVVPLPKEGRPRDFAPTNVGSFSLAAKVDAPRVAAGKGVVLSLTISGAGNLAGLKLPELPPIDGFRSFPPSLRDEITRRPDGVFGAKVGETLLVPTRGGRLAIPPIHLPVFDPVRRDYVTLSTEELTVFVEGDPTVASANVDSPPPSPTPEPATTHFEPPRPLRFRSTLEGGKSRFLGTPRHLLLLGLGPALYLLLIVAQTAAAKAKAETPASKKKRALAEARSRLKRAQELLDGGAVGTCMTEVSEVLLAFASQRAGTALRGLTLEEAASQLLGRGADSDLVARWSAELEHGDFARFAPGGGDRMEARGAIERAHDLLDALDAWAPKEVPR